MELFLTSSKQGSRSHEVAVPPGLVAESSPASPVGNRHNIMQEVLMKTAQTLSQTWLQEVSSTASDMSAADIQSLDTYGDTRLQSAESEAWKASGPGESTGRGMSPRLCADPFVFYSEDHFSIWGPPTVDVSVDKMPDAPVAFTSWQTKPLKLFCGWCGTRRTYPGVLQSFCNCCGNVLDDADKTGDEAAGNQRATDSMWPSMYPDTTPWTTASGGAAAWPLSTNPTKPAPGDWSSANQAAAGFNSTVQAPDRSSLGQGRWWSAEFRPQKVLCSVEEQTRALHEGASSLGFAEGPMQQSFSVEGFRI